VKTDLIIKRMSALLFLLILYAPEISFQREIDLLEPYPLQSGHGVKLRGKRSLDVDGVLVVDYGEEIGKKHNPTSICQYAHSNYIMYYTTRQSKYKTAFLIQANWLIKNQKKRNGMGVWEYDYPNKSFNAEPPWISAMAQGLAISVLSEAYSLTKDEEYKKGAYLALKSFQKSIDQGGVVSYWPNGDVWYEEIATEDGKKILNGFIFSLAGVNDFYKLTGSNEAKAIVEKGLLSLNNHIHEYDLGFASGYSIDPYNLKWGYNIIHASKLAWAYILSENEKFLEYARRFLSYEPIHFQVDASETNNPKHGPERLNDFRMFYNYWSSKTLPVDIYINFEEKQELTGLVLYCVSEKTSPQDYSMIIYDEKGNLSNEFEILKNKHEKIEINNSLFLRSDDSTYVRTHLFKNEHIYAKKIFLRIKSDNGNNNVAIREIAFIIPKEEFLQKYLKKYSKRENLSLR
jgi:heparosan-N-sulfate-glucuronate 5-epimerase